MARSASVYLAVALDGAGWHGAAWREPDARPGELFTGSYWVDLVKEAESGWIDFVTIEDGFGLQSSRWDGPDGRTDQVRGRLDAVLIASRVAPATSAIGLVPTATTTHTEPFHLSKAIATLDYVSGGRAGWRAQISGRAGEAAHFGRRTLPTLAPGVTHASEDPDVRRAMADVLDETSAVVEVVRRLWDSWEDDAEIRDIRTGRFVDRQKLHYIDFEGPWFRVRGPSITPRPPQGQPPVAVLAHTTATYRLAADVADVVFVTPSNPEEAGRLVANVRSHEAPRVRAGQAQGELPPRDAATPRAERLRIFADLLVFLDPSSNKAEARRRRLDELDGQPLRSDAVIFTGTARELADLLSDWRDAGIEGFRLRPAALPHDLLSITRELVPELQRRGAFRTVYEGVSLRERLGLPRPANRYAA